ncbi:MAG TPA: ATP-grasp domain-containing protein [Actinophytocola sp.]|uniref:ATP-grasp domain-containing protein n=1 Tax=Actinophytocola sp. TaxID=1872138 RepID=UPI002DDD3F21|nr:ATP-grasp domain-containing protein [Actinophytocola sp.]HEV2783896.1 ATP-grasp domain-containing protein [Actinophytocola sp.]
MATVLILGGAPTVPHGVDLTRKAIRQAHARGLRVHLTDQQEALDASPGMVALADTVSAVDFTDPAGCAVWAKQLRDTGDVPDIVVSPREYAQIAVADVVDELGLPGNSGEVVRRIRSKDACREWLREAGFAQPRLAVCGSAAEAAELIGHGCGGGPWIVKPRDAMGSLGVSLVRDPAELDAAVAALPRPGPFLIEEYVDGPEYSVEGVFLSGQPVVLAITEKKVLGPGAFVEVGHVLPAPLPEPRRARIEREVRVALRALGLRFGLFHVELWWTADGPVLGEVHGRPGGDWIHLLLGHAIPGLELYGLIYDDLLGAPPGPLACTRAAAVRFLTPPPGRITSITGFGEAAAHPAVLRASCDVAVGHHIGPLRDSFDRAGVLVVGADTVPEAERLATDLAAAVEFRCEPVA